MYSSWIRLGRVCERNFPKSIFVENVLKIVVQLLPYGDIAHERAAVFGGEYGVEQDFGQWLRQGGEPGPAESATQPLLAGSKLVTNSKP
jgi:hypothetical protein